MTRERPRTKRGHRERVYLASPCGFTEGGRDFMYRTLVPMMERLGCEVLDPWKGIGHLPADQIFTEVSRTPADTLLSIAQRNIDDIRSADYVVAVLDGPDVDSGVAAEVGFAYASGKMVFGYRSDFRLSGDNAQLAVNLAVEGFVTLSGGSISRSLDDLGSAMKSKLGPGREP